LKELERVTTICRWGEALPKEKLLLVTSTGLIRPYPIDIFRSSVETPVPLKFSRPLPGDAVAALGVNDDQQVVALTHEGRAVRYPVADLSISGTQAINCGATDRVRAAAVADIGDGLLLVTADGYGRIMQPEWLPVPPKPNSKARSQIARRSPAVALCPAENACLVTNRRLVPLDLDDLLREDSTRTELLLKLEEGEGVETTVSC
jgi:DNA gyrase/topoisomerase IV subunit A